MSETVAISLITALAGFFGALLGALGAVFGPWWLRRSDRKATERAEKLEIRRVALVEWLDAEVALASLTNGSDEQLIGRDRANRATSQVASRLSAKDEPVLQWLAGLSNAAISLGLTDRHNLLSVGGHLLFSWHRGTLDVDGLTPFSVRDVGNYELEIKRQDSWF